MPKRKTYSEHYQAAYRDGRTVARNGGDKHDRPSYPDPLEREAFREGWDDEVHMQAINGATKGPLTEAQLKETVDEAYEAMTKAKAKSP